MPLVESTTSFGVDSAGEIESIFMFASSLHDFWKDNAEVIESGEYRVLVKMELVPAYEVEDRIAGDSEK